MFFLAGVKNEIFWKNGNNSSKSDFEVLNWSPKWFPIYWHLKFWVWAKKKRVFFGNSIFRVELRFSFKCPKMRQKWHFWIFFPPPDVQTITTFHLAPFVTIKTQKSAEKHKKNDQAIFTHFHWEKWLQFTKTAIKPIKNPPKPPLTP